MTSGIEPSSLDVVIIGGSQAGLAIGHHLAQRGLRFVILDAGPEVGHAWRSRWDSLRLFTPAQYSSLPGMAFPSPKDTYPSKEEVATYLSSYVSTFDLPVRLNSKVTSLSRRDEGYVVGTPTDEFPATQVVVATGPFQTPFIPAVAGDFDDEVFKIHSADYRHPAQLPEGRVLVVGGGNSGFQIATELATVREVDLAVGKRVPSLPQRLLGKDLFWWLSGIGFMKISTDSRLGRKVAKRDVLIGSSPRGLRRSAVTLRKRLTEPRGGAPSSTTEASNTSTLSSGLRAIAPTTPGSTSQASRTRAEESFIGAASRTLRACSSSGSPGSTLGDQHSSGS